MEHDPQLTYKALLERDGVQVSQSPWGPDDHIGRLNWITPEASLELLRHVAGTKIFDLSVDYFMGMPALQALGDPPFQVWMTHTPGGSMVDDASGKGQDVHRKYSFCGDAVSMYTHLGTHIDTLVHLGYYGHFWNGINADEHLGSRGWTVGGADRYPPIIARGVLLDIAGLHGVGCIPDDHVIGPEELKAAARKYRVELRRGDVVTIRTGKLSAWPSQAYLDLPMPGINLAAARFLCEEAGAMIVASDTAALEAFPGHDETYAPVHCYMLATAGTPIMEVVNLQELSGEGLYEFAFVGMPLPLRGTTGSPIRPLAIALEPR
jgi:kynurenine formamidase